MYRRCLIPTLNMLTRAVKPQFFKNHNQVKCEFKDIRFYRSFATTTSAECSKDSLEKVSFEDVKCLAKDKQVVIIDVREPNELTEHGVLPGSINIPLGDVEETFKDMSPVKFLKKYGQCKPEQHTPIVFSCMRGVRSEKAQIIALQLGYKNVKNYLGGWTDWAEKSKQ